ncbi:hypothetical protein C8J56DRAFT_885841 [Mycena floridula]|nr:hypothetical protein C8J56DRAFT_885841 [Mycena floridula]
MTTWLLSELLAFAEKSTGLPDGMTRSRHSIRGLPLWIIPPLYPELLRTKHAYGRFTSKPPRWFSSNSVEYCSRAWPQATATSFLESFWFSMLPSRKTGLIARKAKKRGWNVSSPINGPFHSIKHSLGEKDIWDREQIFQKLFRFIWSSKSLTTLKPEQELL